MTQPWMRVGVLPSYCSWALVLLAAAAVLVVGWSL